MLTVIAQDYLGFAATNTPAEPYPINTPTRLSFGSSSRARILSFRPTRQEVFGLTFTITAGPTTLAVLGGFIPDQITGDLFELKVTGYNIEDVRVTASGRGGLLVTLLGDVE